MGDQMNYCGIYKITNKLTNKCYIGQSNNILYRWKQHLEKSYDNIDWHTNLQNAIQNYTFEVLAICPEEQLNSLEDYYIRYYDSINNGYNKKMTSNSVYTSDKQNVPTAPTAINIPHIKTPPSSTMDRQTQYPYSIKELTEQINVSAQSIYEYKKKYKDFFKHNSVSFKRKIWYNQAIFDCLMAYYGPRE